MLNTILHENACSSLILKWDSFLSAGPVFSSKEEDGLWLPNNDGKDPGTCSTDAKEVLRALYFSVPQEFKG